MSLKVKTTMHVIKQSGTSLLANREAHSLGTGGKSVSGLPADNTMETYYL